MGHLLSLLLIGGRTRQASPMSTRSSSLTGACSMSTLTYRPVCKRCLKRAS